VPVNGIDWYPTLLELAGIPVPKKQDVDGVSIVPLLKGGAIADRPLYWHYPHYGNQGGEPSSIITQDDWKLIYYHEDGRDELYHLTKDPAEKHDLARREPSKAKALRAKLDAWLKSTDAKLPAKDATFDLGKREARWESLKSKGKVGLEKRHANYLAPGYKPNKNWWGSAPVD
jgi:arylsulfatase A-like enzyme